MTKKSAKSQKKPSAKRKFSFKIGFNTIPLTIMVVLLSVVIIFDLIMFACIQNIMTNIRHGVVADSFTKLQSYTQAVTQKNWGDLRNNLNGVMNRGSRIIYVVVTDTLGNKDVDERVEPNIIYSSVETKNPSDKVFEYKMARNPGSFKLLTDSVKFNDDGNDYNGDSKIDYKRAKPILIKYDDYYVYLGVLGILDATAKSNTNSDMQEIWRIMQFFSALMLLATLFISFILARSISEPLSEMVKTVSKIAKGDLSGRLDTTKYQELNQLVESYNMMANALQRLYSTLENQVQDRTRELKSAYAELQNTQAMMVHSEKMKSLGELVAGIMHEINNPINFIYGNMTHLSNYSNDLIEIIDKYDACSASLKPEDKGEVDKFKEEIDYEFLKSDLPELIKSCKEGADRAKNIIQDLKSFSRMEEVSITDVDLVHEIDTTLNILYNKFKNKAQIHKEYMENVPRIEAFGGQLNQVFMNILDNAIGAIQEQGDIWIRINLDTKTQGLVLEIEDNGVGMDEETAQKVFDPFFTTKPVGQGTGLGMSITHKIIKNHQGNISIQSEKGVGTKFIIKLPLNIDRENLKTAALSEGEDK